MGEYKKSSTDIKDRGLHRNRKNDIGLRFVHFKSMGLKVSIMGSKLKIIFLSRTFIGHIAS